MSGRPGRQCRHGGRGGTLKAVILIIVIDRAVRPAACFQVCDLIIEIYLTIDKLVLIDDGADTEHTVTTHRSIH